MAYSVSIILPTINEEENLKLLIPDLIENLDGIDYSIIVADDGSSDNSKEYVESLNLVHKNITFLNRTSPPSLPMSIWDGIEEYGLCVVDGCRRLNACKYCKRDG